MSTTTPPPAQGQIQAPNPVELFWEKHRPKVLLVVAIVVAIFAVSYGSEYLKRQRVNAVWGEVAKTTNLDDGYAEPGSLSSLLDMQNPQFNIFGFYFSSARDELLTELGQDIANADEAELLAAIEELKGTDAEPLLLWTAAYRSVEAREWDQALARLDQLAKGFPNHFLCAASPYPPQYRPEVEKEGEEKPEPKPGKPEAPELEPAVAGSAVAMLRGHVEKQQAFEAAHAGFYHATEPDAKPTVVVKLSTDEEFRIRFYRDAAPEHVDAFLANVRAGFYNDMAIDEVQRRAAQGKPATWTEQLHLGLPAAKGEDRTQWTSQRAENSTKQLEFEDNELSHFAGVVAAAKDTNGKSSGERIWITGNDCAVQQDGTRVIFGRVVEGLDVVQRICREAPFVDEAMSNQGRGQLQANIRVVSMEILDDPAPLEEGTLPEEAGGKKPEEDAAVKPPEEAGGKKPPEEGGR